MYIFKTILRTSALIAMFVGLFGVVAMVPKTDAMSTVSVSVKQVAASSSALKQDACKGLRQVDSSQGCGTGSKSFYNVIKVIVNLISYIVGIVAVIMIMVSGIKYMTSGGDSQKVSSAKDTLVYALIGLAVVVLAQFLVQFVLNQATKTM